MKEHKQSQVGFRTGGIAIAEMCFLTPNGTSGAAYKTKRYLKSENVSCVIRLIILQFFIFTQSIRALGIVQKFNKPKQLCFAISVEKVFMSPMLLL